MPPAATWMDSEIVIWSKVSQRKTNTILYHLYMEPKKMIQMNLFTKQKQTRRYRKQTQDYQRGKGGGAIETHYHLYNIDKEQGPTVWHRELCLLLCGSLDGRGIWGRIDTCIYIAQSLCCSPATLTTLLIGYTPI